MTYEETIAYLFSRLPMYSRIGSAAYKKDLNNIRLLCEHLGNPYNQFKSIHIAGTNGKGSTSHLLASVLQTAGYKTGLYTSPHLYDFRERVKINGEMVSKDYVVHFVEKLKPLIEEIQPSFFEITVALAFAYFAEQKVDIAIIEVGLGGRLDSTNIITPIISIITNIGWDHMDMLGNSLAMIAGEKAGIIKTNVPVIIGEANTETKPVFLQTALVNKAPIVFAEDLIIIDHYEINDDQLVIRYHFRNSNDYLKVTSDLTGIYQVKNLRTVLTSIQFLQGYGLQISQDHIQIGLSQSKKNTVLKGRWDIIQKKPWIVLEVAHNEDGIRQMISHINQMTFKNLHIVFGMVKDKEVSKILHLLPVNARYYFTQAQIPRALNAKYLQEQAAIFKLYGSTYENVNDALKEANSKALENDLIIVCGSIFLVAEVDRALFSKTQFA